MSDAALQQLPEFKQRVAVLTALDYLDEQETVQMKVCRRPLGFCMQAVRQAVLWGVAPIFSIVRGGLACIEGLQACALTTWVPVLLMWLGPLSVLMCALHFACNGVKRGQCI